MPLSLTSQGWLYCMKSDLLNPPNANQTTINQFVGKPLRFVVRLLCSVAMVIVGPFGTIYHLFKACAASIELCRGQDVQKNKLLVWEHLKQSLADLVSLQSFDIRHALKPNQYMASLFSESLVQVVVAERFDFEPKLVQKYSEDVTNMQNSLFRYDMLIHCAFVHRETTGLWPQDLASREIQQLCINYLEIGGYAVYRYE